MNEEKTSIISLDEALEIETKVRVLKAKSESQSIFDNPIVQIFSAVMAIIFCLALLQITNNMGNSSSNNNNINITN
jgi:hypothetical protein